MTTTDSFAVWRDVRALVIDGLDGYRKQVAELTGLPFSRVRALRRLRTGPLTHAALAEAMMVDRPAATVAVDDLRARIGGLRVAPDRPPLQAGVAHTGRSTHDGQDRVRGAAPAARLGRPVAR